MFPPNPYANQYVGLDRPPMPQTGVYPPTVGLNYGYPARPGIPVRPGYPATVGVTYQAVPSTSYNSYGGQAGQGYNSAPSTSYNSYGGQAGQGYNSHLVQVIILMVDKVISLQLDLATNLHLIKDINLLPQILNKINIRLLVIFIIIILKHKQHKHNHHHIKLIVGIIFILKEIYIIKELMKDLNLLQIFMEMKIIISLLKTLVYMELIIIPIKINHNKIFQIINILKADKIILINKIKYIRLILINRANLLYLIQINKYNLH